MSRIFAINKILLFALLAGMTSTAFAQSDDFTTPPVTVESIGRLRSASIAIPSRVLMRETLSAPPFSAARGQEGQKLWFVLIFYF